MWKGDNVLLNKYKFTTCGKKDEMQTTWLLLVRVPRGKQTCNKDSDAHAKW
jgi:hypothetical protein